MLQGDVLHAIFERITRQREPEAAQTFKREVLTLCAQSSANQGVLV